MAKKSTGQNQLGKGLAEQIYRCYILLAEIAALYENSSKVNRFDAFKQQWLFLAGVVVDDIGIVHDLWNLAQKSELAGLDELFTKQIARQYLRFERLQKLLTTWIPESRWARILLLSESRWQKILALLTPTKLNPKVVQTLIDCSKRRKYLLQEIIDRLELEMSQMNQNYIEPVLLTGSD